jgi:hypothetical protein
VCRESLRRTRAAADVELAVKDFRRRGHGGI